MTITTSTSVERMSMRTCMTCLLAKRLSFGLDAEVLPTDVGRAGRDQFGRVSLSTVL